MISDTHDALFIHVPKCAGISVKTYLRACGFWLLRLDEKVEDVRSGFYKQGTAARLRRHLDVARWERSFKFCVCRNPYDRLVSGWSFCREKGKLDVPFDYFVWHLGTFDAFWVQWHCVLPQRRHVVVDGEPVVNATCRFESLERDLETVATRLGLPDVRLPHANPSRHKPYREHYTRELQDLVYERFQEDFEFFGYPHAL